jgi:uncharacterized membrane protein (DUF106 family)
MKSYRLNLLVVIALLASFLVSNPAQAYIEGELLEEMKNASSKFEKAISVRNFKVAKEQLEILYPLMKKEIKLYKKEIHSLEKEGETQVVEDMKIVLARKMEIDESLHTISTGSSASLRVQADNALKLVKEYMDMVDDSRLLLSSND